MIGNDHVHFTGPNPVKGLSGIIRRQEFVGFRAQESLQGRKHAFLVIHTDDESRSVERARIAKFSPRGDA
jgi:hypothetical protein